MGTVGGSGGNGEHETNVFDSRQLRVALSYVHSCIRSHIASKHFVLSDPKPRYASSHAFSSGENHEHQMGGEYERRFFIVEARRPHAAGEEGGRPRAGGHAGARGGSTVRVGGSGDGCESGSGGDGGNSDGSRETPTGAEGASANGGGGG